MPGLKLLLGLLLFSRWAGRAWILFWFYSRQSQWDGVTRLKTRSGHSVRKHIQCKHLIGQEVSAEGREPESSQVVITFIISLMWCRTALFYPFHFTAVAAEVNTELFHKSEPNNILHFPGPWPSSKHYFIYQTNFVTLRVHHLNKCISRSINLDQTYKEINWFTFK